MLGDASMPGKTALKGREHGNTRTCFRGRDYKENEEQKHNVWLSNLNHQPTEEFHLAGDHMEYDYPQKESKDWSSLADLSQDDTFSLEGSVKLERRWMLWHKFMKEYTCLDDWLRFAEKLAASPNSSNVPYITAKEELQRFKSLRTEARLHLVQLDSLNQRSRILLGMFSGTMRTRLVEMTRECGQRWDQLSSTVDSICRRLKHFVLQREDFERQREEMAIWLADMDLRLTEVEHFSESNTCTKMQQLQGFQDAVSDSAGRLNALLQQGEELIQRSEPADAQVIENQLQELLLYCGRVFQGLGRLHTRLLSMRLVFEEDWALCPDSGCPSETVLEEEGSGEHSLASLVQNNPSQVCQEQLVLEWDPSVDIGGSISHDDADSLNFNTSAGVYTTEVLHTKDTWRRRSHLRPSDSPPAPVAACVQQLVTESSLDCVAPLQTPVPDTGRKHHDWFWKTSTPDTHSPEPANFDPDRISAWLVQTPRLCSRGVQTEDIPQCSRFSSLPSTPEQKGEEVRRAEYLENPLPKRRSHSMCTKNICSSQSCDLQSDSAKHQPNPQHLNERLFSSDSEEDSSCTNKHRTCSKWGLWPLTSSGLMKVVTSTLFWVLLALLLVLMVWLLTVHQVNQCHRSNSLAHSFHIALNYVNGPPPT